MCVGTEWVYEALSSGACILICFMLESQVILQYTYGVNAWKNWVLQKNASLETVSKRSSRFKLFKTDLLQMTADELNYSLCLFVKEVRKPNGESYASDSVYYLCLGASYGHEMRIMIIIRK